VTDDEGWVDVSHLEPWATLLGRINELEAELEHLVGIEPEPAEGDELAAARARRRKPPV